MSLPQELSRKFRDLYNVFELHQENKLFVDRVQVLESASEEKLPLQRNTESLRLQRVISLLGKTSSIVGLLE